MNTPAITIYHNPACGTSRNVLALIRNSGAEPAIVEYLKTPPGRDQLLELIAALGVPVRSVLRRKGTPYDELKLDDPKTELNVPTYVWSSSCSSSAVAADRLAASRFFCGDNSRSQRMPQVCWAFTW